MSLVNWISPAVSAEQVETWGVEVARGCHDAVMLRLGATVLQMSLPTARGYIQARAALVLDQQMDLLQHSTGCDDAVASAVHLRAMDEVLRLSIGNLLKATQRQLPRLRAA
jgi:hypothetical protein